MLLGKASRSVIEELADIVGNVLGWDNRRREEEVERVCMETVSRK